MIQSQCSVGDERVGYTFGGEAVDPDQPACVAKRVTDGETGRTSYWVKRGTSGPESGHLFNPNSPTFEPAAVNRVVGATGRRFYEFVRVSKDCFDFYLKFLEGGNTLHLRQAEREMV